MSGVRPAVLEVGDEVRFTGGLFTLAGLEGHRCRLVDETGAVQVLLLTELYADPGFAVVRGGGRHVGVPASGVLDGLDARVREKALAWQRHVREVETGYPDGDRTGAPRPGFDPAVRSLAEREAAKAAELTTSGQPVSVATVRRMRARYRRAGLLGLVDGRARRPRSAWGRADERVVAAVRTALAAQQEKSAGTLSRLRRQVGWILEETYGPGAVSVPPASTFNRLVRAVADGPGVPGGARPRRRQDCRPEPPFMPTVAVRPGELVMMDTTPLDVLAVLDDGVTGRLELTLALDVATRSITAAILRPRGTKAVDAAVLLAQSLVPEPLRPGWSEALAIQHSAIPYERLAGIDARLKGTAARPVIWPSTVVIDQGSVFVSRAFQAAAEYLGITVQPCPPASGHAKGHVERTFGSIGSLFTQYVAAFTGSHLALRGRRVEEEACWTLAQLQELLDEWVIVGWQERRHSELRHPLMPKLALSPNEMWAALVGLSGHVPVPLQAADYIELLPSRRCAIGAQGIQFDYRTYDGRVLNAHRRRSTAADGKWEVHYNPYEPTRIWVRLPDGWAQVDWIHRTLVSQPFSDATWRHIRSVTERRGGRAGHEEDLARALDALLRRSAAGTASAREQTLAARARAAADAAGRPPRMADLPDRRLSAESDENAAAHDARTADRSGPETEHDTTDSGGPQDAATRPWKIFNAREEAERW